MKTISFKRGNTFAPSVRYSAPGWTADDLAGVVVTSDIGKADGTVVAHLSLTPHSDGLGFDATVDGGTASWPLGTLYWDCKLSIDGFVVSSNTYTLDVLREITK